ncbi:gp53-like domain-containing protein [Paraburkholderia sp. RL17-337-BIB-A]|uniref:gp53-like domain-containing protein n=1 Tax=Paraburkholderia sp. RL17-337-BIB-A TaxID=3031636 RepID=UPI0038BB6E90
MFPTDQPTAVSTLPTPASAGTPGFFTGGNPAGGQPATLVDADWLNMLQQELLNIVTAGGLTPSKTTYNQVLSAIKRIGQNTLVLTDTGNANAYAAANPVPLVVGTWADGVVQAVKIAHANTGASTYAPDGLTAIPIYGLGLQPLQGGELALNGTAILMHATIAGVNSGNPICVLMECAGGAQQVAPATQSNQAVNLGQFGSSLAANGYQKLASGLIIQWGGIGSIAANGSLLITYPIAFPTAVLGLSATAGATSTASSSINGANIQGSPNQKANFYVYNSSASVATQAGIFIAIGY